MIVISGGFTLDDTVLLNDEIMRKAPGGNIVYATVGARIWSKDVAMFGVIGQDYPQVYLDYLESKHINVSYVQRMQTNNIHMWALLEENNNRQLIYKLSSGKNKDMDPKIELVTEELLQSASSVHVSALPFDTQQKFIDKFKDKKRLVTLDTIHIPGVINPGKYKNLDNLSGVNAFLPSKEEVEYIWGETKDIKKVMLEISESGVKYVVVKCGDKGALLYDSVLEKFYHIPIYSNNVKDTTGAGDAFCGGFIAGLDKTKDPLKATVMGSISSSFVIEEFGALHVLDNEFEEQAKLRYEELYKKVKEF